MKRMLALLVLLSIPSAFAAKTTGKSEYVNSNGPNMNRDLGIGFMLGEPTGVDLKYWLSPSNAVHFGFAYSFNDYTELMGNYLWEFPRAFGGGKGAQFVPYLGLGGALFFDTANSGPNGAYPGEYHYFHGYTASTVAFGARIPFGIEFLPHGVPIGITAELAPGIGVFPGVFGFFQGFVGARFYL